MFGSTPFATVPFAAPQTTTTTTESGTGAAVMRLKVASGATIRRGS